MQTFDDIKVDIEMYFKQILSLADLIINKNDKDVINILTVRNLAQLGLTKLFELNQEQ